jgi:hypothetical protein
MLLGRVLGWTKGDHVIMFRGRSAVTRMDPEAGPELDREIHRIIEGEEPRSDSEVPPYSTDDATAIAMAARFSREWGWWLFEKKDLQGEWVAGWIEETQPLLVSVRPVRASAPTRPLALCRAVLHVVRTARVRPEKRAAHPDRAAKAPPDR